MNILLESRTFHPAVGGLETMSMLLASEWRKAGHHVRIMSITPLGNAEEFNVCPVIRNPSVREQLNLGRWCHIFVQNGISLRSMWTAGFNARPRVFIHQNSLDSTPGGPRMRSALKRMITRIGKNIAVSRAISRELPASAVVIPNAFHASFDCGQEASPPRKGLIFVGRLVSVKGVDIALDALCRLHKSGITLDLTICGDGPERPALMRQARRLGITDYVHFKGWTARSDLRQHYRRAELSLVPSRYEPFGIVALESIACGCPVVASGVGGLPDAVGPCGFIFEPGNAEELADKIQVARTQEVSEGLRARMDKHIALHRIEQISRQYIDVFESILD